jgi:4-alpha-glucanotransferase
MFKRASGIVLHPTSLPGPFGVGDLGPEAYRFAEFLARAGQSVWQVLPLGPTGYGDSPYQCFSAFAGNPILISPEKLVEQGLLSKSEIDSHLAFSAGLVDYEAVKHFKDELLRRAFVNFRRQSPPEQKREFEDFAGENAGWLDDYALFMALKQAHGGEAVWTQWEPGAALRRAEALAGWRTRLAEAVEFCKFRQFLFFTQWQELKQHCHRLGVRIMGDVPIYVAHDSADVWTHRELFCLAANGEPEKLAGVPPDYFSATGQLWGNPIYRWEEHARAGYGWWVERFRSEFARLDICRIDHFRGFAAHWEVPAGEKTAIHGRWAPGPGAALFEAVECSLGKLPIVAENLGVITADVEAMRNRFGFPGMSILQFAFGKDPQAPDFKPHNYPRNRVAYTGTHDNDTTVGWWTGSGEADSTRTGEDIRQERDFARRYLGLRGDEEINWVFIRTVMASVASLAMFPLQDVLGLGSQARMNLPGTSRGNWRWRLAPGMLTEAHARRLRELAATYDRETTPDAVLASTAADGREPSAETAARSSTVEDQATFNSRHSSKQAQHPH